LFPTAQHTHPQTNKATPLKHQNTTFYHPSLSPFFPFSHLHFCLFRPFNYSTRCVWIFVIRKCLFLPSFLSLYVWVPFPFLPLLMGHTHILIGYLQTPPPGNVLLLKIHVPSYPLVGPSASVSLLAFFISPVFFFSLTSLSFFHGTCVIFSGIPHPFFHGCICIQILSVPSPWPCLSNLMIPFCLPSFSVVYFQLFPFHFLLLLCTWNPLCNQLVPFHLTGLR